jgi:hypothetical protein
MRKLISFPSFLLVLSSVFGTVLVLVLGILYNRIKFTRMGIKIEYEYEYEYRFAEYE